MTGRVEGKVAFITGAARGQGRAHAVRLAQEGADIIAIDLCDKIPYVSYMSATEEDLAETVRLVEEQGRKIIAKKLDIRDRPGLESFLAESVAAMGKLDIVVANAGICIMKPWDEYTWEEWDYTIATNLTGTWNTCRIAAPYLVENGGGSMIITSSAAGLKAQPFLAPYTASKHAVVGVMRQLAAELAKDNVRVNTLHPTGVASGMASIDPDAEGDPMEGMSRYFEKNPRIAPMLMNMLPIDITECEDQANAVLFLASDEARYVTAHTFAVDAGVTQF